MSHDYFYGTESEQYAFLRVPRMLFTDKHYKHLSSDSKILYGLLLERMSLSRKNGWFDEYNRVYIIFPIEEIKEQLGCCHETAVKLLAELGGKGIDLIERVRRGLGQPDIIYVKNFADGGEEDEATPPGSNSEVKKERRTPYSSKKSEKPTSGYRKNRPLDVGKTDIRTSEKPTSGHRKNRLLDVGKTDASKTNNNYTYGNHTESIHPSIDRSMDGYDVRMSRDQVKIIREKVKRQIEFEILAEECNSGMLNEVVNIMTKVLCSTAKALRIGGLHVPIALVQDAYLRLCPSDIESVIAAYMALEEPVQNPTGYMTSMLYHAPDSGVLLATNLVKSRKDSLARMLSEYLHQR